MPISWSEAPDDVIALAEEIVSRYHESLTTARIGFVMRSEAPRKNGKVTLGQASVVSAKQQVFMPYDFIIWLAEDEWAQLSGTQRRALIDHELSHCQWDGIDAKMRGHDLEEFAHIVERYGLWRADLRHFAAAVQTALPLPPETQPGVRKVPVEEMVTQVMDEVYESLKSIEDENTTIEIVPALARRTHDK